MTTDGLIFVGEPWHADMEQLAQLGRVLAQPLPGPFEDDTAAGAELLSDVAANVVAVPLTEEWVLACAVHNFHCPEGLRTSAALAATDRHRQRTMLPGHRSPWWEAVSSERMLVVKMRASSLSSDLLQPDTVAANRLAPLVGDLHRISYVIEERVPGAQYEINGVVGWGGELLHHWQAVKQTWSAVTGKIDAYEPAPMMTQIGVQMLRETIPALGLAGCGVNLEWRQDKIMDVHARLGEDPREIYTATWAPEGNPAATLIELLVAQWTLRAENDA